MTLGPLQKGIRPEDPQPQSQPNAPSILHSTGKPIEFWHQFQEFQGEAKNFLNNKVGKNDKLSTNEPECQLKEGLCLYCREKGHVAHDCPKLKAAKAHTTALASDESRTDSVDSKK